MVRLLIHQALKDVRVLGWLALVWLLLVAACQAVTLRLGVVPAGQNTPFPVLIYSYTVVQALLLGLFAVIAVIVVQSDSAVGTTAFWFTRPISVPTLLAAKFAVTLVLLVIVPIVADLVTMVAGGLSLGEAISTVPVSLATQLAWLVPLLALAAITTSLAQFVLATLVEVLIFVAAVLASRALVMRPRAPGPFRDVPSTEVLLVVLAVGLVAFGFVALLFAYRKRTLGQAATVTAAAPVVLAVLLFVWPWSLSSWRYARLSSPVAATGTFRLGPPHFDFEQRFGSTSQDDWSLTGAFRFSNVPPRETLSAVGVHAWIDYAGEHLELAATPTTLPAASGAPGSELRALSDAAGMVLTDASPRQGSAPGFTALVRKGVYEHYRNESGVFHADVRLIVAEKQTAAVIDVRAGEHYRITGRSGEILGVSATPDALSLQLRDVAIKPLVAGWTGETDLVVYAVRNARLRLASLPSRTHVSTNLAPYQAPIPVPAHLSASWVTCDFPWPEDVSSAEWLRGAQLVVVDTRTLGDTIVHVTIPDFVLSLLRDIARPMPR